MTTAGVSLPVFFAGLLLVYVVYFLLGWAPAPLGRLDTFATPSPTMSGFLLIDTLLAADRETFRAALAQMMLPGITLAFFALAPIARITRASMLAALSSEFIRTARASGLSSRRVIIMTAEMDTGSRMQLRRSSLLATLAHTRYIVAGNGVTAFAFMLLALIVFVAIFGPYIVPFDPLASSTSNALRPPSARNWFGTDQLGRDVFSRVLVATRLDLAIAVFSVALVFAVGGVAGIAAGFFGGWTDRIIGCIADTIMAFPLFVLAMGIVAALGNTVTNIVLATAIINFPLYVRLARAEAAVRRNAGFVQAAP